MRRLIVAASFVVACGAAWASGYDDYMRGYEARRAGNFDLALTSYTAALAAGDLAPTYQPDAHLGRAEALLHKGRCAEAITDLDAALVLRPNLLEALTARAHANNCLGRGEAALADLDAAITVKPNTALHAVRADFQWYHGNFAAAAEDYLKAVKLQPERAYEPSVGVLALLGYAISAARAKTFDPAVYAAAARDLPHSDWPGPLMDFIAGKKTAAEIYREAARGDGEDPVRHKCVADFFIGEWQFVNGNPAGKALLISMEQTCPRNAGVLRDARYDLKRIP